MSTSRKFHCGFTLMELIVVLVILSLLASLAVPVVSTAVLRAKESALKETLLVTRKALDDYYADNGEYPDSLEVLVEKKYLRHLPRDPFIDEEGRWEFIRNSDFGSYGIQDIKSTSNTQSRRGDYYSDW